MSVGHPKSVASPSRSSRSGSVCPPACHILSSCCQKSLISRSTWRASASTQDVLVHPFHLVCICSKRTFLVALLPSPRSDSHLAMYFSFRTPSNHRKESRLPTKKSSPCTKPINCLDSSRKMARHKALKVAPFDDRCSICSPSGRFDWHLACHTCFSSAFQPWVLCRLEVVDLLVAPHTDLSVLCS